MHEAAVLSPGEFSLEAHQRLFRRIQELDSVGKHIDHVTLCEELGRTNAIEAIGGVPYIYSLTDCLPHRHSIANYVEIVREKAKRRRLIHALNAAMSQAAEPGETTKDCLSSIEDALLRIEADSAQCDLEHVAKFSVQTMDELLRIKNAPHDLIGLTTGLDILDSETTGYRGGELVFIGGRPKAGKGTSRHLACSGTFLARQNLN